MHVYALYFQLAAAAPGGPGAAVLDFPTARIRAPGWAGNWPGIRRHYGGPGLCWALPASGQSLLMPSLSDWQLQLQYLDKPLLPRAEPRHWQGSAVPVATRPAVWTYY